MTWTPDDLQRLKALRDRPRPGPCIADAKQWHEYEHELSEADPLSRIEELEREVERRVRIIAGMRDWLDDHSDVEDGEGEDARPMPNWAMRGLQELEALEAQK